MTAITKTLQTTQQTFNPSKILQKFQENEFWRQFWPRHACHRSCPATIHPERNRKAKASGEKSSSIVLFCHKSILHMGNLVSAYFQYGNMKPKT